MTYRVAVVSIVLSCLFAPSAFSQRTPVVALDAKHRKLFEAHCYRCHNVDEQNGQVRLDDLPFTIDDVETAERWQKILNALNSGEMPPEGEKPLPASAKTDLLDELANAMVAARKKLGDQGGAITMRRLNRREYGNTLRELLGVKINVSELPGDAGTGGFDTAGQNLFMSATQIEQYQSLGREALEEACALAAAAAEERARRNASEPAPATFRVHTNRQPASISAQGLRKFRFECEAVNDAVAAYVSKQNDDRRQAERWAEAVAEAAARPENQAIVAELRKASKSNAELRRSWAQIKGAPSPESFGFQTKENNADKANVALGENWQKYHEYYLSRPALDRGAYLGVMTLHPSRIALDHLQLPVPGAWKSGDYIFRVRVAATADSHPEQRFLQVGMHPRNGEVLATFEVTGTLDHPQVVEFPFTVTRAHTGEDRTLWLREKGAWDTNQEGGRKRSEALKKNGIGPVLALWIDWMEVERVSQADKPIPSGLAALDLPLDDDAPACSAEELSPALTRFATVAFRGREPSPRYVQSLVDIYAQYVEAGAKPGAALKDTLSIVLASPMFLYLAEPAADGEPRQLTDLELATRLSYFLWSAPPDETLLDLAKRRELSRPDVLAAQTTRLLDDPRADEFVHGFVYQWLGMERFDFFEVNRPLYPHFDNSTRRAAKNEVYETFAYLLRHNAPVSDLLKADYVVINRVLADFYGIPNVSGDTYRKVSLPADSPRGGLLGMAAVNLMGGNGERSNPVERGVWVLRKLLNDPPPPAPANVPQIERLAGKVLTIRERLSAHQEDPQCASCHRKIDQIGFGLENFDAVGQWRTQDFYQVNDENGKPISGAVKTWTVDAGAAFHEGPAFENYFELRDLIASRSHDFAAGFSAALIEYALGRPVGFGDEPLIAAMVDAAGKKNLGTRAFVQAVVQSETFRLK